MNTKISYLYRDADNYKKVNGCVITQMKETEEITEELKVQDQMTWVRAKEQLAAQEQKLEELTLKIEDVETLPMLATVSLFLLLLR